MFLAGEVSCDMEDRKGHAVLRCNQRTGFRNGAKKEIELVSYAFSLLAPNLQL